MLYNKFFILHPKVRIRGIKNIETAYRLNIGVMDVGFSHKSDKTYLNIRGKFVLNGDYYIGRGSRLDIGPNAIVKIGKGGFTNVQNTFIITNKLEIGDNCVISWNCQFLDNDFHEIQYEGKKEKRNEIIIGDNVWIGCGVSIYKGTVIPDGCVIASNSVVRGVFTKPNSVIAGNPAKTIINDVTWS
ncbi:acyltransferase [Pedobacter sp. B4-66]|uniref:acyltransferase n=1 Tax=Pedobacter sp. B4-66 TaxID=2817280 RepID=UPI001BD91C2A|nr:acyltransferase [Pedobacter sp. B4-66]